VNVEDLPAVPQDLCDRLAEALSPWLDRPPCPVPRAAVQTGRDLTAQDRSSHERYCRAVLHREATRWASMRPNSGRNHAAFRLACRVGRWAHHRVIAADEIVRAILAACERNGLLREDGRQSVLNSIASGFRKSAADALPNLGVRRG
jgi:hypothetical protein